MTVALVIGGLSAVGSAASAAEAVPQSVGEASASRASVVDSVVKTADLSKFQAGNIISDAAFFNTGTMSEAQIQSFLQSKVPTCQSGYVCLKDWYDTSRTTAADAMCGAYSGGMRERSSTIIHKVAQACGINPQVLLVMLQKEQGLVTHTWPSDFRYQAAMGQGCPDTAACDTRYYGFFNQVYGAAWQMKRYANPAGTSQYFTWYAPGKIWNVRWHPNEGCGSAPVYIQNQATANLYYYTPYQPNAAAIRAGYGEGDGCSSYGNRNFYQYFTDWFGSPTVAATPALIQSGEPVYLVSGGIRFHVSAADYPEFTRTFGATSRVSDLALAAYRDGGAASLFIRNGSTGDISLLQSGSRHHFSTCDQVALWGSQCGSEMVIPSADFTGIASGPAMSSFARRAGASTVHLLEPGKITPLYDDQTASALNGGSMPYAATIDSFAADKLSTGVVRFAPARLLTVAGSPRVYLPTVDGRLLYVSSWARAHELGVPANLAWSNVPESTVAAFARGELTDFVSCAGRAYYAASGVLSPVNARAADGFVVTPFDDATCGRLSLSTAAALDAVYLKATGQPEVYLARAGVYRHVTSSAVLMAMNDGAWPTVLALNPATVAAFDKGAPIERVEFPAGTMVKSDASPRIYLTTGGGDRFYVRAWAVADELGIARTVISTVPPAVLDGYSDRGDLSLFVSCDGVPYFGAGGVLNPIDAAAASGFALSALDNATCARTTRSDAPVLSTVFVQVKGAPEIYVASGGVLRHVSTMAVLLRLSGGVTPTVLPILNETLRLFPAGDPIT